MPTVTSYVITNVEAGVNYVIEITAIFDDRLQVAEIALRFDTPPSPEAEINEITENSANVEWAVPDIDTGVLRRPVNGYKLTWLKSELESTVHRAQISSDAKAYELENLDANSTYEVTLRAYNGLGDGVPFSATFTTKQSAPTPTSTPSPTQSPSSTPTSTPTAIDTPSPTPTANPDPLNLSFRRLDSDGVIVTWSIPELADRQLMGFELIWSIANSPATRILLPPSTQSYKINDVEAATRYEVRLAAIFDDSSRLDTRTIFVPDLPDRPELRIASKSSTHVELEWEQPASPNDVFKRPVDTFKVSWQESTLGAETLSTTLNGDARSFNVQGLFPSTSYEFTVRASNGLGDGEAAVISATTEDPPIIEDFTPTPVPVPIVIPVPTPTKTPSPSTSAQTDTRSATDGTGEIRDSDPDPPEDLNAALGRDGVLLHWDDPRWDGGSEILAYAIDWHPESPRFPLLVSGDMRSMQIYGLSAGVNYRTRVKALNRKDDSLPATDRITLADTLIRRRSRGPFVGSIAYARATVLENRVELPGFSIHSHSDSLFWGDQMIVEVTNQQSTEVNNTETESMELTNESDTFSVKMAVKSRRSRFDESANAYPFAKPVRVCIAPQHRIDPSTGRYAIEMTEQAAGSIVLDSTPIEEKGITKICSDIWDTPLNATVSFALVATDSQGDNLQPSAREESRSEANAAIALLMFFVAPMLMLGGIRALSVTRSNAGFNPP